MKSYFLDISPQKNSGFCNQIYSILYTCGHALRNNIQFIFIGKYLKAINTQNFCNVSDVIDLNATNQFLKNYNVFLVDYHNFSFTILDAKYGVDNMCIDVTNEIKKYCENNKFYISTNVNLNSLTEDPVKFFKDKFFVSLNRNQLNLYITYSINNITFQEIYEQQNGYLKKNIVYDLENGIFQPSLRIHNDLSAFSASFLKNIVFNNEIISKANAYIEQIIGDDKNCKINCIHLRLEDDAIEHWSKENNMNPILFKFIIEQKYIAEIQNNIDKDDTTIILSHNYNNKVIEFLTENKYKYVLTPKMDENRDVAAMYDMQIGQHCNNVFILVYDSSFSYTLLYRMNEPNKIKPIQLFYILQ